MSAARETWTERRLRFGRAATEDEYVGPERGEEGEGLRLERPVGNFLGEGRVPREEGRRAQIAVLTEHVGLRVVLVVTVAPPRGGAALQQALEKVLRA